jgi:hypothetical protein
VNARVTEVSNTPVRLSLIPEAKVSCSTFVIGEYNTVIVNARVTEYLRYRHGLVVN